MAAFFKWCVFGILVLADIAASGVPPSSSDDLKCVQVTLKSTQRNPDERRIRDDDGKSVSIVKVDLLETLSTIKCIQWKTYYYRESVVAAKHGCQGKFRVCYRKTRSGPEPTTSTERKCVKVILRSRHQSMDKEQIKDESGKPVDIISITIIRKIGSSKCELDDSYLIAEPFVVARRNCEAEFKVCYRIIGGPVPTVRPGCKLVRLLSRWNRDAEETLDEKIISMKIARNIGDKSICEQKNKYGYRGKVAYAKDGCRAEFEVCFSDQVDTDDLKCVQVTLKSTQKKQDERRIRDDDGKSVSIVKVDVIDTISTINCVPWKTYYYKDSVVIVKHGCQAKFKVCYKKIKTDNEPGTSSGCIAVTLISTPNNSARKTVAEDSKQITSITVQRQFSGISCVRNSNYGIRGHDVYASGGCRAVFLVCLTADTPDPKHTEITCVNVLLASGGRRDNDWKKVTAKDGSPVKISSIRVVKPTANDECIESKTLFRRGDDEVHAINGCRGTIRVCFIRKA